MLTVVQHQQQLTPLQVRLQKLDDGAPGSLAKIVEGGGDGAWNQQRVRERREFHEANTVEILVDLLPGDLKREPRLADTTRSREDDEAMLAEQPPDFGDIAVT